MFEGLIGLRVQLVQGFNWLEFDWFNRFKGSIGSRLQLVQGFKWFKNSMSANV